MTEFESIYREYFRDVELYLRAVCKDELLAEELTEQLFDNYLFSAGIPDPELIIRPSGEQRISNFLLWQSAYTEFIFMDTLWPDFGPAQLEEAIEEYYRRNRRFGGT